MVYSFCVLRFAVSAFLCLSFLDKHCLIVYYVQLYFLDRIIILKCLISNKMGRLWLAEMGPTSKTAKM